MARQNTTKKGYHHHWRTHKYATISPYCEDYIKEYRIWRSMMRRCNNKHCDMYKNYGGRGIRVCDRWKDSRNGFINFYNDMGARPYEEDGQAYQLDRIDVNGDYCPENCRWVTAIQNGSNKRSTKYIILWGEKYCITDACRLFGVKRTSVTERVRLGRDNIEGSFVKQLIKEKGAYYVC